MTISESYPIHRCVFRNDQFGLKELLNNEEIKRHVNDRDNHNNTPLHLALMLGHTECVLPLINSGCDVISVNSFGWNPVEEATMLGNKEIVRKLTITKINDFVKGFLKGKNSPFDQFDTMVPNFHLKIRIKFKSPVPVLAEMCPKDTIEIFKSGNCLRINTTIAGMNTSGIPKAIKGKQSFIAIIDKETGTCKTYLVDCVRKIYQEFYPVFPDWCIENIIKSNVDVSFFYKFMVDLSSLTIKQKKGNLLKKGKKTLHLERGKAYKADVFKVKGLKTDVKKRYQESVIGPYKSDVKTRVLKIDGNKKSPSSDEGVESIFTKLGDDLMKANNGKPIPAGKTYSEHDDDSDSDSDDDMSDTEQSSTDLSETYGNSEADPENQKSTSSGKGLRGKNPKYLKSILVNNIESNSFGAFSKIQSSEFNGKFEGKVSNDGKTIVYEVDDNAGNTLNWDEMYDLKHPGNEEEEKLKAAQGQKKMYSERMKDFDFEKNKLTEATYFDPSQRGDLHVGRIFDVDEEKKSFDTSVKIWMSRDNEFPITLDNVKPILSYAYSLLEYDQAKINKFTEIFKALHSDKRYPIKIEIPILPILKCQLKTVECNIDPSVIPQGTFSIPNDYTPGNVLMESRKKNSSKQSSKQ